MGRGGEDVFEIQGAEGPEDDEHAQQEAEVADTVDHEGLLARVGRRLLLIPEADEQIGTQPHAFPTHEHQQEVVGAHQQEHVEDEEVEIGEVAGEPRVVVHVTHGVDVDQGAHSGDHQEHDERQGIDQEGRLGRKVPGGDPGEYHLLHRRTMRQL